MVAYSIEQKFVIAEGEKGEIYLFIEAKQTSPQPIAITYDGKDHAIFDRTEQQHIILDYIHPSVRDSLRKAGEVLVVEVLNDNIQQTYHVKLNHVENIDINWQDLGLTTWEEASLLQK